MPGFRDEFRMIDFLDFTIELVEHPKKSFLTLENEFFDSARDPIGNSFSRIRGGLRRQKMKQVFLHF